MIFLPMAISAVAAGVIWRLMYDIDPDVGTLNASSPRPEPTRLRSSAPSR